MRSRMRLASLILLFTIGCGKGYWHKPNHTVADLNRDKETCQQKKMKEMDVPLPESTQDDSGDVAYWRDYEDRCLEGKDWRWVKVKKQA